MSPLATYNSSRANRVEKRSENRFRGCGILSHIRYSTNMLPPASTFAMITSRAQWMRHGKEYRILTRLFLGRRSHNMPHPLDRFSKHKYSTVLQIRCQHQTMTCRKALDVLVPTPPCSASTLFLLWSTRTHIRVRFFVSAAEYSNCTK